eukprot:3616414-Amphidinium_carterae.1
MQWTSSFRVQGRRVLVESHKHFLPKATLEAKSSNLHGKQEVRLLIRVPMLRLALLFQVPVAVCYCLMSSLNCMLPLP